MGVFMTHSVCGGRLDMYPSVCTNSSQFCHQPYRLWYSRICAEKRR